MDFNAYEWIRDSLYEELEKQGFNPPEALEDPEGRLEIFVAENLCYGLFYDRKHQRFELRSTTLTEDGKPGTWRSLSTWLFDEKAGARDDAESILNDFLEVVRGSKRMAVVRQKTKRGKDDDRTVDAAFFLNRLVNIFPELKRELNEEKITYGQVRPVTFVKTSVVPKVEDLAVKYPDSEPMKKLCALLDDMYKNGDMDLRSVITSPLLNGLGDGAFEAVREGVGEELQKDLKYTRKLKGKTIKPEKKKKQKKVEARLDNRK